MTSADYKTGHADGVSETRQELGREIERIKDKWRVAEDMADERGQEIDELREQRDEAREAARGIFQDGDDMSEAMRAGCIHDWPWLEETE